ncbi:hypothetical protein AVEN_101099-1 [Araneus ventricosus]|uniref:Uncharacterized protein n=1 Tax=Araneus ventricosus TaxID=182803 RepID=A0A4Y2J2E8_ARAVE|nr:hypothetical protein AVEN_101099-1 [Araneus ventricosus]
MVSVSASELGGRPRRPSGKVSALGPEGSMVRNPIPLKIRRVWGLLHAKSYAVAKRPPVGVVRKFGDGVRAHVLSSSSDRGSKLRVRPKIALVLLQNGTLI